MSKIFLQCGKQAFFVGGILALYISLTMFCQMSYSMWLAFHNLMFVASLLVLAFIGYQHCMVGVPFTTMLLSIVLFFVMMMFLYIGSFTITTKFLVDRMVWIPFFYHDYNYHGFKSVIDYLNHGDNYRELLGLQVFTFSISSVMYFAAGSLGYSVQAMMNRTCRPSGMAQSGR